MPEKFLGWTQLDWQAVGALGTWGTLFIGALAAVAAFRQVRAARISRGEQSRPYVIIDIEPGQVLPELMDLVVKNIGKTPAYGLTIRFSPPPSRAGDDAGHPLTESRLLRGTIPMLAPGRELRVFFDSVIERQEAGADMRFKATVRYNHGKTPFNETAEVDMDIARGSLITQVRNQHHLVRAVEDVVTILKKSPLAGGPVPVVTEDRESYSARQSEERTEARRRSIQFMEKLRSDGVEVGGAQAHTNEVDRKNTSE